MFSSRDSSGRDKGHGPLVGLNDGVSEARAEAEAEREQNHGYTSFSCASCYMAIILKGADLQWVAPSF